MERKQVLKVNETFDKNFVGIAQSSTRFADDYFFENEMGEAKEGGKTLSYPVNVVALKTYWLVKLEDGKNFLTQVLQSNNMDLFKITSFQMLIEYLYKQ